MSNITSTINDISVVQSTISPSSLIGTYTQYEGSGTLSALADIDLQGVTDGSILVYDTNEFVARTLSGDATINSDGVLTLKPNFVTLGTNTSGAYVSTLTGTPDQITVLGSGGETANVTLSLPQSIATSSSPTFNNITLSGIIDNTDLTSKLALKAPLASPSFTGTPTAPTPLSTSNDTSIATTSFVTNKVSSLAPLNSPTFTGTPTAPTPLSTSNDTSIATTSFVTSKLGGIGGFVDLTSNQTIAGTKSFTGQLVLNFSQNQLVLKNGSEANAMLITVPAALTANRTITIPDVGFSGAVVLNVGPQNISGIKTFTTSPIVPTPTTSDQAASKGYVDGIVSGNHTHTASAISDSTSAGRAILTAADHPAQITALSNITSTGSTTINLTAADSGKILRCTSSDVVTINMPSTDPGGNFTVAVIRSGTGTVTFAANGKTLNSYNNMLTIAGRHAWASVIREDVDVYNLSGTLSL